MDLLPAGLPGANAVGRHRFALHHCSRLWTFHPEHNGKHQRVRRILPVAYGAEDTGCSSGGHPDDYTDVTLVATGNNAPFTLSQLTPCVTMENIASSLNTFYSDYLQSGSGVSNSCVDNAHTVTALVQIFASISSTFTTPRLIPASSVSVVL